MAESLVYRVRGRGTFATPFQRQGAYVRTGETVDDLLSTRQETVIEVVRAFEVRSEPEGAARLELPTDEVSVGLVRRVHEGAPFSVSTVMLPPELAERIERAGLLPQEGEYAQETMLERVERVHGVPVAGAEQTITAVSLPADLAALIDCEPGSPAVCFDRLFFDRDGRKVELARTLSNPERYVYRLELRRSG